MKRLVIVLATLLIVIPVLTAVPIPAQTAYENKVLPPDHQYSNRAVKATIVSSTWPDVTYRIENTGGFWTHLSIASNQNDLNAAISSRWGEHYLPPGSTATFTVKYKNGTDSQITIRANSIDSINGDMPAASIDVAIAMIKMIIESVLDASGVGAPLSLIVSAIGPEEILDIRDALRNQIDACVGLVQDARDRNWQAFLHKVTICTERDTASNAMIASIADKITSKLKQGDWVGALKETASRLPVTGDAVLLWDWATSIVNGSTEGSIRFVATSKATGSGANQMSPVVNPVNIVNFPRSNPNCSLTPPTVFSPLIGSEVSADHEVRIAWVTPCPSSYVELSGSPYTTMNFGGWQNRQGIHIGRMWPGTFTWRVKVANAAGRESAWSEPQTFTVGGSGTPPPTACSTTDGVTLYDRAGFGSGACHTFGVGEYRESDLAAYGLVGNASSLRNSGYHVTLFDRGDLTGTPGHFDQSESNLSGFWENRARSMRVERRRDTSCNPGTDGIILYHDSNYRANGGCLFLTGEIADLYPLTYEQSIGSIKIVGSYRRTKQLVVYRGTNFQNECGRYWQNWDHFQMCGKEAMSVRVVDYTPPPPIPVPPDVVFHGNIAPEAYLHPTEAASVVDGNLETEWAGPGSAGSVLHFSWASPATINRIMVWDRNGESGQGGRMEFISLAFSDGTMVQNIDLIVAGPHCAEITFPAKNVTWVQVIPYGWAGYREVEIWATTGEQASDNTCANPRSVTPVPGTISEPPVVATPVPGNPGTPITDLVVSTIASESSDGQAHGATNPYLIPLDAAYDSVVIRPGAFASTYSWNGSTGGTVRFTVSGTVLIEGTLTVDGKGYRGAPTIAGADDGRQGESYPGLGIKGSIANGGGGGGGNGADSGGAGAGYGTAGETVFNVNGDPANGGEPYGDPALTTLYLGSGGGSSGAQSGSFGGYGGRGGGAISITARTIIVTETGHVSANGADGAVSVYGQQRRAGGGGSGGSIFLRAETLNVATGRVTAIGGVGPDGFHDGTRRIDGGNGGDGRIRMEYSGSVSGTSMPPASVARVSTEPVRDLIVSLDPERSVDGQSHDASNPYLIPLDAHYDNVLIEEGAYASTSAWNGSTGGTIRIIVSGTVQIDGVLTVDGKGYRGAPAVQGADDGRQGESYPGLGGKFTSANGGGGGGGSSADSGGAGGGYGTSGETVFNANGDPAYGGRTYGDAALSTLYLGSGGGSSGAQSARGGGGGGAGGGAISITAAAIIVNGRISANGADGQAHSYPINQIRSGGGGSGGSILLHAATIDIGSGTVTAVGGLGPDGLHDGARRIDGGNGGVGRIRIEYTTSLSGGSSPEASIAYVPAVPVRDLVVSLDPSRSTDRQAHGSDNPYYIPAGATYDSVLIEVGAYASVGAWNGSTGGTINITVTGTVLVEGTLTLDGKGYRGGLRVSHGNGRQGESLSGAGTISNQPNGGGGGGSPNWEGGGGGGGYATSGETVVFNNDASVTSYGGQTYGDPELTTLHLGSGGGSSGGFATHGGAEGGAGGGALSITADQIIVTGRISVNGANGEAFSYPVNQVRAGGGGSGGSIFLHANIIDIGDGRVTATGGSGPDGNDGNRPANGGDGGLGRVRIEYSQSLIGSSVPEASVEQFTEVPPTPTPTPEPTVTPNPVAEIVVEDASAANIADGSTSAYQDSTIRMDIVADDVTSDELDGFGPQLAAQATASEPVSTRWSWDVYDSNGNRVDSMSLEDYEVTMTGDELALGLYRDVPSDLPPGEYTFVGSVEVGGEVTTSISAFSVAPAPDNYAPDIASIDDQAVMVGATTDVDVAATDADGDPLTFSAEGLPAFTTLTDHGDGKATIHIAPGASDSGFFSDIAVRASDGTVSVTEWLNIVVVASNQPPIANAGTDRSVADTDGNGSQAVTLDASQSSDPDGTIDSYTWTENGSDIGSGATPVVDLTVGSHVITLTVTDNDGATATDDIIVTVTPVAAFSLSIVKDGTGRGTITSTPSGINCGAICSKTYANATTVTLKVKIISGSTFTGWGGACSGTATSCVVRVDQAKTVTAAFSDQTRPVRIAGRVQSGGQPIANVTVSIVCKPATGSSCLAVTDSKTLSDGSFVVHGTPGIYDLYVAGGATETVNSTQTTVVNATAGGTYTGIDLPVGPTVVVSGTVTDASTGAGVAGVKLTITIPRVSTGGPLTIATTTTATDGTYSTKLAAGTYTVTLSKTGYPGQSAVTLILNGATTTQDFTMKPALGLTIVKAGTGTGTVKSTPSGINCGSTCTKSFTYGTAITLKATIAIGSTFTGWSVNGDTSICPGLGTCSITLTATTSITATFSKP